MKLSVPCRFVILSLCIFGIVSCHSRRTPINQLKELTENISAHYSTYTLEDWNTLSVKYDEIMNELEKFDGQYTVEEKQEIAMLQGKCLGYFVKYSIKTVGREIDNAIDQVQGLVDGFTSTLNTK